jgi:hypothetical protein
LTRRDWPRGHCLVERIRCWENAIEVGFGVVRSRCWRCGGGKVLALRLLLRHFRPQHGELLPDELLLGLEKLERSLQSSVSWLEVRELFRRLVAGFAVGISLGSFRSLPKQVRGEEKGGWPGVAGPRIWPRPALAAPARQTCQHRPLSRMAKTRAEWVASVQGPDETWMRPAGAL